MERVLGPRDQAHTRAAGGEGGPVRFYAEKHLRTRQVDLTELPAVELIVLLRDPRDTYLSIEAFNAKRGEGVRPIGRSSGDSDERFRARFIATQRDRLQWIAGLGRDDGLVVRYADLVTKTSAVAELLHERLSIDVDHEAASADNAMRLAHATSESPAASVGRWRAELTAELKRLFKRELGDELHALGFPLS